MKEHAARYYGTAPIETHFQTLLKAQAALREYAQRTQRDLDPVGSPGDGEPSLFHLLASNLKFFELLQQIAKVPAAPTRGGK